MSGNWPLNPIIDHAYRVGNQFYTYLGNGQWILVGDIPGPLGGGGGGTHPTNVTNPPSNGSVSGFQIGPSIPAAPSASFEFRLFFGRIVQFTNTSRNASSYIWTFGEGTGSAAKDPIYTYLNTGTWTVTLTARNGGLANTVSHNITVTDQAHAVDFSYYTQGKTIHFINLSSIFGASSHWSFGDGATSDEDSPSHEYTNYDTYQVSLTVEGITVTKDVLVSNMPADPYLVKQIQTPDIPPSSTLVNIAEYGDNLYLLYNITDGNSDPQLIAMNVKVLAKSDLSLIEQFDINNHIGAPLNPTNGCIQVDADYIYIGWNIVGIDRYQKTGSHDYVDRLDIEIGSSFPLDFYVDNNYIAIYNGLYSKTTGVLAHSLSGSFFFTDLRVAIGNGRCYIIGTDFNTDMTIYRLVIDSLSSGSTETSYEMPLTYAAIAVDSTNAYFRDQTTNLIVKYSLSDGSMVGMLGNSDILDAQHQTLAGDVDYLYTAGQGEVQKWSKVPLEGSTDTYVLAAFSYVPATGKAPLSVSFTDHSLGTGLTYVWDFGDGETSSSASPVHVFDRAGIYQVRLTVSNSDSSSSSTKTVVVTPDDVVPPIASFTADAYSGTNPTTVHFTDTSTGSPEYWSWKIDGTEFSTAQSPSHTFSADGSYIVSLTVTKGAYVSEASRTIVIGSTNLPPTILTIGATATIGTVPLAIDFSVTASGSPTSWLWNFGDGHTATAQNPSHTYTSPNRYTVMLTATNAYGSTAATLEIVAQAPTINIVPPVASFTADVFSGTSPTTINFKDTSTGSPTGWSWRIGGVEFSTSQNPSHTFSSAGTFVVSLTVTKNAFTSTTTHAVVITAPVAPPVASFTADVYSGTNPTTVSFTDTSTGSPTGWSWKIDTVEFATTQNAQHAFTADGEYVVSLTVTSGAYTSTATRTIVITSASAPPIITSIGASHNSGYVPLTVEFTVAAQGTPTSWAWTFGDGGTSTDQNPTHVYETAGTYTATVTVSNADGDTTASVQIDVLAVTGLPPVIISIGTTTPTTGAAPLTVEFTADATDTPNYLWNFGDGHTSTTQNPTNTFTDPGTYTVTLTVSNANGSTTSTIQVIVEDATVIPTPPGGGGTIGNQVIGYYVVDTINNRVLIYESDGTFIKSFGSFGTGNGQFNTPTKLVQVGDYIYVVDQGNNRIEKFTHDGTYVSQWGSYGSGPGQFISPYDITSDGTYLYVTDTGNNRVEIFDLNGNYIGQFGTAGTDPGQFESPMGIATDGHFIYVVDQGNNRFEVFTMDGAVVEVIGSYGSGDNQFNAPTDIWVDDHFVYIDDTGNNRIVIYEKNWFGNSINATIPFKIAAMTTASNGVSISGILPFKIGAMSALRGALAEIAADVPMKTAEARSGWQISATVPAKIAAISATTVPIPVHIAISADAPMRTALAVATIVPIATIEASIPMKASAVAVGMGSLVGIEATVPMKDSALSVGDAIEIHVTAVRPMMIADVRVLIVPVATGFAVVMNTTNHAITEYDGYNFNSIGSFRGNYYGVNEHGIFVLSGDDDNGSQIDAVATTGDQDFYGGQRPRRRWLRDAWVQHTSSGEGIELSLEGDRSGYRVAATEILPSDRPHRSRAKFPRGVRSQIYNFSIRNQHGAYFKIYDIGIDAETESGNREV